MNDMTVNSMATNQLATAMARIATGQRINSAADDAAGLAIAEKMEGQIRGINQGIDNTRDMQNLVNTAEGALSNVGEGLLRIRELSIQASNGTLTQSDRELIQREITQIVDHISTVTSNTEFNTIPLLEGRELHTASYADGSGMRVNTPDMAEIAKTLTNYNVASEFNIADIDTALAAVAGERANLGAASNRMDFTVNNNAVTAENLVRAQSQIRDANIAEEITNMLQEQTVSQIQLLMQRREQERLEHQQVAPIVASAT
jgi:flagellin